MRNVGQGTGGVWTPGSPATCGTPQDVDFVLEFDTIMLVDCALPTLATVTHPGTGAQVPNFIGSSGGGGGGLGGNITMTTYGFHNNIQHFRYELHYNSTGPAYQDEVDALCGLPPYPAPTGWGGYPNGGTNAGSCGLPSSSQVANTNTLGGNSSPQTAAQSLTYSSYGGSLGWHGDWTLKFFNDHSMYASACYDFTIPCNDLQP